MVKYLIYTTEQDAINKNASINNQCVGVIWTDSITNNYCHIKKHPTDNKWALIYNDKYSQFFTIDEINSLVELTDDWNPPMPILSGRT